MTTNKNYFESLFEDYRYPPKKTSIKIAIIGDGSTGKTSYFNRIASGDTEDYKFSKNYDATRGCNICQIEFMVGSHPITLHIFDTAGQEKFGELRDSYLMGVDGIILMYDITNKISKKNILARWIPEIKNLLVATKTQTNVPIIVVANKNDRTNHIQDPANPLGIRTSALNASYDIYKNGPIDHCTISVKADENMLYPINWLLKHILSYYLPINVKRSKTKPYVMYCNK